MTTTSWELVGRYAIEGIPHVAIVGELGGERAMVLTPDPDDPKIASRPVWRRVAIGRLRCYVDGRCPECGGEWRLPNRADRRRAARTRVVLNGSLEHEHHCSLSDDALAALAAAERN